MLKKVFVCESCHQVFACVRLGRGATNPITSFCHVCDPTDCSWRHCFSSDQMEMGWCVECLDKAVDRIEKDQPKCPVCGKYCRVMKGGVP